MVPWCILRSLSPWTGTEDSRVLLVTRVCVINKRLTSDTAPPRSQAKVNHATEAHVKSTHGLTFSGAAGATGNISIRLMEAAVTS